jgi:hypothetical protein
MHDSYAGDTVNLLAVALSVTGDDEALCGGVLRSPHPAKADVQASALVISGLSNSCASSLYAADINRLNLVVRLNYQFSPEAIALHDGLECLLENEVIVVNES